jgi:hypothetical protein
MHKFILYPCCIAVATVVLDISRLVTRHSKVIVEIVEEGRKTGRINNKGNREGASETEDNE